MSAKRLYKTGEMIDKIKVGQRAKAYTLNGDGDRPTFRYEIERGTLLNAPFQNITTGYEWVINEPTLDHVWELQPMYVPLQEALLALAQGKRVKNGDHTYYFDEYGEMVMAGETIAGTINSLRLYKTGWEIIE